MSMAIKLDLEDSLDAHSMWLYCERLHSISIKENQGRSRGSYSRSTYAMTLPAKRWPILLDRHARAHGGFVVLKPGQGIAVHAVDTRPVLQTGTHGAELNIRPPARLADRTFEV